MAATLQLLFLRCVSATVKIRRELVEGLNNSDGEKLLAAIDDSLAQVAPLNHGHMQKWRDAIAELQTFSDSAAFAAADIVQLGALDADASRVQTCLEALVPWRKGPFRVAGVMVDTEWRCEQKFARLEPLLSKLHGQHVLDVGCGNGYFALRLAALGAAAVVGIDPTALYVMQFRALAACGLTLPVDVLPLSMEDLHAPASFDTVLSMGVLYHRRSPLEHLRQLHTVLKPGGTLVLETLVVPGNAQTVLTPKDRYARMRNVWQIGSSEATALWLERIGFKDVSLCDVTTTATDEQRSTDWMPFESLAAALDPDDPSRTIEGYAAPARAIFIASR